MAGWQNRLKIFNFAPTKIKNSMKYGFVKVAAAVPAVKVADCEFNVEHIISMIKKADEQKVGVICFPELCITATLAKICSSTRFCLMRLRRRSTGL